MLWHIIGFVWMFWLLAFAASLLLSSPILFSKLRRRYRWRPPTPEQIAAERQQPHPPIELPRLTVVQRLLSLIASPFMLGLLILVVIPAFFAMWFCAVLQNYRYLRRTVYRALRRERILFPAICSYPAALIQMSRKTASGR